MGRNKTSAAKAIYKVSDKHIRYQSTDYANNVSVNKNNFHILIVLCALFIQINTLYNIMESFIRFIISYVDINLES